MRLLLQGLLTGNFRRWGPIQYRQYRAAVGHLGHTGYELEFPSHSNMLENNPDLGRHFKWSNVNEIQWLVSTTCPKIWYKKMREVDARLKKHSLPTTGSIHLNIDVPGEYMSEIPSWAKLSGWLKHTDYDQVVKIRLENKFLKGYIIYKDLILQTILFGLFVKQTRSAKDLTAILSAAYEFYTPTELEFRQDLGIVLERWGWFVRIEPYIW